MTTRYYVLNNNTLGFVTEIEPHLFQALAGNKDGLDWKNGPYPIGAGDKLRDARLADFEEFRVRPEGHLSETVTLPRAHIEQALRLFDDMSRHVGAMALQDYAAFNEVPMNLNRALR